MDGRILAKIKIIQLLKAEGEWKAWKLKELWYCSTAENLYLQPHAYAVSDHAYSLNSVLGQISCLYIDEGGVTDYIH